MRIDFVCAVDYDIEIGRVISGDGAITGLGEALFAGDRCGDDSGGADFGLRQQIDESVHRRSAADSDPALARGGGQKIDCRRRRRSFAGGLRRIVAVFCHSFALGDYNFFGRRLRRRKSARAASTAARTLAGAVDPSVWRAARARAGSSAARAAARSTAGGKAAAQHFRINFGGVVVGGAGEGGDGGVRVFKRHSVCDEKIGEFGRGRKSEIEHAPHRGFVGAQPAREVGDDERAGDGGVGAIEKRRLVFLVVFVVGERL